MVSCLGEGKMSRGDAELCKLLSRTEHKKYSFNKVVPQTGFD